MKLLITDNEAAIRNGIKEMLKIYCPEITVVEEAAGVQEGLQKIKSLQPDILLLDVEMEDGTGFDLLKQVSNPVFQLIFITAHNKYAIDAFRFSAIDFLLKPIDPELLQQSIQRALKGIRTRDLSMQIGVLLQQVSGKTDETKKIVLKDLDNVYYVKISEILYCMAEGTYTKFYFENRPTVTVSKNLGEYENILEAEGFIRPHHSYLLHPDKIIRLDKKDGGSLIFENGVSVPVSQRKRDYVMQILENR